MTQEIIFNRENLSFEPFDKNKKYTEYYLTIQKDLKRSDEAEVVTLIEDDLSTPLNCEDDIFTFQAVELFKRQNIRFMALLDFFREDNPHVIFEAFDRIDLISTNPSERQLQDFLEFKSGAFKIGLILRPQGDNTCIHPAPINLCIVKIEDKEYKFGGIRESFYDQMAIQYDSESKVVRATMIAFDKSSGATYSDYLVASTKEEANKQFAEFEQSVPFTKWYYEIQLEELDLTPTQEEIVSDLEEVV